VSYGFGLLIESLVAILLLVTIGYCALLNKRLNRLRADEQSLKATIGELITATEIAERAVLGLKATARECESTLGERLVSAERCCAELGRHVKSGDKIIERLARVVSASRKLDEVPAAEPPPPANTHDPKAVADAARSFANRLRERMGALAA
jgi:Domain of unknown function (DUF6468)